MNTYRLSAMITVSAITVVKANSLEEAIEIAQAREGALDHLGNGTDETEAWMVGEIDGEPFNIHGE